MDQILVGSLFRRLGTYKMQQARHKQVLCGIGEEDLRRLLALFRKQALADLKHAFRHMRAVFDLVEDVPVVQPVFTGRRFVVADHHVAGAVKFVVKVALRIKNDHDIVLVQPLVELLHDMEKGVRFTGADTAEVHDVAAENVGTDRNRRPSAGCVRTRDQKGIGIFVFKLVKRNIPVQLRTEKDCGIIIDRVHKDLPIVFYGINDRLHAHVSAAAVGA